MTPVNILFGDLHHPVYKFFFERLDELPPNSSLKTELSDCVDGATLFLVSYSKILKPSDIEKYSNVIVLHASDLPSGRGWSPHVWSILSGHNKITVSAVSAAVEVDTGAVWSKISFVVKPTDLFHEINENLFRAELQLIQDVYSLIAGSKKPKEQDSKSLITSNYWPRRYPKDSEISINDTFRDAFNLLRVSDPDRFPVYFDYEGETFEILIRKREDHD